MEMTCPECRHVVEVDPDQPTKCGNCGASVSAPAPVGKPQPFQSPEPPAAATQEPAPSAPDVPPVPITRAASNAAFVLSLLFFIPFVPQVLAIGFGLFAVSRKRLPNERVTLAWLAIVLSGLIFPCWIVLITSVTSFLSTLGTFTAPPYAQSVLDGNWTAASKLTEEMERVHAAASAHRRDFAAWPRNLDTLIGSNLPHGFKLSHRLTFRPVPPSQVKSTTWVLLVSDELNHDIEGNQLGQPHRLVLRLNGRVEVLPASQVETLLAEQPLEDPPAEP